MVLGMNFGGGAGACGNREFQIGNFWEGECKGDGKKRQLARGARRRGEPRHMKAAASRRTPYDCAAGVTAHRLKSVLLELGVFGFGLLQDGDIGVGVSPQREEVFVGSEGAGAGCVSIGSLRGLRLKRVGTGHSETR